jgi:hypothetical protein
VLICLPDGMMSDEDRGGEAGAVGAYMHPMQKHPLYGRCFWGGGGVAAAERMAAVRRPGPAKD